LGCACDGRHPKPFTGVVVLTPSISIPAVGSDPQNLLDAKSTASPTSGSNFHIPTAQQMSALKRRSGPNSFV
jgi:hypothetical protein